MFVSYDYIGSKKYTTSDITLYGYQIYDTQFQETIYVASGLAEDTRAVIQVYEIHGYTFPQIAKQLFLFFKYLEGQYSWVTIGSQIEWHKKYVPELWNVYSK